MTEESKQDSSAHKMWDMVLYQAVSGAQRVRLDDGWCGYQIGAEQVRCFVGHEHFEDERMWAEHCPGPAYSSDINAMRQVEQGLVERGCIGRYVRMLVPSVYPNWEHLQLEQEVFDFWMALLTAPAALRARTALHVLGCRSDTGKRPPRRREDIEGNATLGQLRRASRAILKACARAKQLSEGTPNTPLQRRWIAEILDGHQMPVLWSLAAVLLCGREIEAFAVAEGTVRDSYRNRDAILQLFTQDEEVPKHLDRAWKQIAVELDNPALGPMGRRGQYGSDAADEELDRAWFEDDDDDDDTDEDDNDTDDDDDVDQDLDDLEGGA